MYKTIKDEVRKGSQGWTRQVTVRTELEPISRAGMTIAPEGPLLRATVYRDSYNNQSRIYSEVWSPDALAWNTVETLSGSDYPDLPRSGILSGTTQRQQAEFAVNEGTDDLVQRLLDYAAEVTA